VIYRLTLLAACLIAPAMLPAQSKAPDVTGTWRVDAGAEVKNGPKEVIIRSDSSASWGKETVRWRIVKEKIWIAIGGEWEIYNLKVKNAAMTLSGGDLQKSVTLKKVGPPTPLPTGAKIPADPGTP
jgi:hypothetical protein